MRSEREGELPWHVVPVSTSRDMSQLAQTQASTAARKGVLLLRLSVPVRLLLVGLAAAVLWTAVLWAIK
jgi:hypothetical protein